MEKRVSEYTGLSFKEIGDLGIDEYMFLTRDAYIYRLNQSEQGREYLEKCWILEQTSPDRKRLREKFDKGGETVWRES